MSFAFPSWETAFSPEFYESAKGTLETALNKGNKPPVIQGRIEVVELSMGTQPPTLTLLEIGDLSLDRFRGILRLGYQGDAWLEVRCRVQANPLSHNPNLAASSLIPLSTPLLASQPLLVPMTLRLSKLHLRAILILVVSASKGITLVFKNDPLQNVDVSSTFDSVEVIRGYLQQEIEGQLREMFREDLPGIIHRLSQRWLTGTGVGGRVEMPYRDGAGMTSMDIGTPGKDEDDPSSPTDPYAEKPIFPPYQPTPSLSQLTPKRRALAQMATAGAARTRRLSTALSESPSAYTTFPDIEDYDPTYGLRPEGVPTHSGYEAFGRLWEKAREGGSGLGSLMRVPVGQGTHDGDVSDIEEDEGGEDGEVDSVEDVEDHEVLSGQSAQARLVRRTSGRSRSSRPAMTMAEEDQVEWETFPAVGGGMITRPRVYHAQSQIRAPSEVGGRAVPSPGGTAGGGSITARASSVGGGSTIGSMRRQATGLRTPGAGLGSLGLTQPVFQPLPQSQPRSRIPNSTSASALAGPGPSSLRRMVTSRSDVFLSRPTDTYPSSQLPASVSAPIHRQTQQTSSSRRSTTASRRQSHIPSQLSGTSTSWSNPLSDPQLSSSFSTLPSSTSTSMSMLIPDNYATTSSPKAHTRSVSTSFPPRGSIIGPGGITLPLNNSVSQLAALSHEAQTLSPYARGHEHIAVRSFPHLGRSHSGLTPGGLGVGRDLGSNTGAGMSMMNPEHGSGEPGRTKGNRKRIHRLGSGEKAKKEQVEIQGDVEDYMPLGAVSPDMSPRLGMASLSMRDMQEERGGGMGLGALGGRGKRMGSMTGMASVLMGDKPTAGGLGMALGAGQGMRPNLMRSPDSRSSYGFPQVRRYA